MEYKWRSNQTRNYDVTARHIDMVEKLLRYSLTLFAKKVSTLQLHYVKSNLDTVTATFSKSYNILKRLIVSLTTQKCLYIPWEKKNHKKPLQNKYFHPRPIKSNKIYDLNIKKEQNPNPIKFVIFYPFIDFSHVTS